jgi:hypothetical protein
MEPLLRSLHDLGLAAWFGGAWMGAVGLNGATIEVDDHTQRTRVANAGWFKWAPIAGMAAFVHVLSAGALGRLAVPGATHCQLCRLRTVLSGLALAATLETGWSGRRVVRAGDVPVATAVTPINATPDEVAAAQRRLRIAQWIVPIATGSIWVLNAFQPGDGGLRRH